MAEERVQRRLAAILAADVVGYSKLMGQDEVGTLASLKAHRKALIDPAITEHQGRIVKLMGDGLLVEFASAVDALECAVAIQSAMAERNAEVEAGGRIAFRIGINLGDIIIDGDDIYGDGVNVAARLEALAEPGGVYLSHAVYEQIQGKIDLCLEPLGQYVVKNIAKRISVYRVALDGKVRPAHVRWIAETRKRRWAIPTLLAFLILTISAILWQLTPGTPTTRGNVSIAVMPLSTLGDEVSTRRLADGLTEDIITDLSRFANLEIIASNTTAAYKDKPDLVRAIGADLDVEYLLEGTVQRDDERMRISAQLIDIASGTNLWTQRWDRPFQDIFAVQSELAEQVAAMLGSTESSAALTAREIRKVKSIPPASLKAYDLYLLAVEKNGVFTKEAIFSGIDYATKAISLDPSFARAYAIRARLHFNSTHYGVDYDEAMQAMETDARRAVELDPSGPEPRAALAWYYFVNGRNKEAEIQLRSALEFNPANITLIKMAAAVFGSSGYPEEGAKLADKVLKLDPLATSGTLNTIKDAYFFARRFEDTVTIISRIPLESRSKGARLFLAFSLAFLGRDADEERARDEVVSVYPSISAELLLNQGWAFEREEDLKLFLNGFAASGLPVCASESDLAKTKKPKRLVECPPD